MAAIQDSFQYKTFVVPNGGSNFIAFTEKFKDLRLHGLKTEPGSFAAKYQGTRQICHSGVNVTELLFR